MECDGRAVALCREAIVARVNEDQATKIAVDTQFATPDRGTDERRDVLDQVIGSLPILADLTRGDIFLFRAASDPLSASIIAEAKPNPVPPIYTDSQVGRIVRLTEEPSVLRALSRGKPSINNHRLLVPGHPTVQDVFPVRDGAQLVAALAIEVSLVESERHRQKSVVYRRAVSRLRSAVVDGQLRGPSNLSRLTEHDGAMVVNGDGEIVYISSLAEQLYRKVGYTHSLLHHNVASLRTDESVFFKAVESGTCVEQIVQEGSFTWLKRAIPLTGRRREPIWSRVIHRVEPRDPVILTVHDVTLENQTERELRIKSAMIQEIHHRVKNNLQTIAALLRLQARRTGTPEVSDMLKETISRILSIAVIHEFLAHQESSNIDMQEVAQRIIAEATRSIVDPEKRIHFVLEASSVFLPTQQATSCSLIINELLQNTVEHGFADASEGTVRVRLSTNGERVVLEVSDDGAGLPPGFDPHHGGSLGLQIVQTLVKDDLKGTFQMLSGDDRGARAVVSFPYTG